MTKFKVILSVLTISILLNFSVVAFAEPSSDGLYYSWGTIETPENITSIGTEDDPVNESGIHATSGAVVTLHQNLHSIFTTSNGVYANFVNSLGSPGTSDVTGQMSKIVFSDIADIKTSGNSGHGAYAHMATTYRWPSTYGASTLLGGQSEITFKGVAEITTSGENSYGAYAYNSGQIDIAHSGSHTISNTEAKINFLDSTKIITSGNEGYGAYTYSYAYIRATSTDTISNIKSGITFLDTAEIITSGENAHGVYSNNHINSYAGGAGGGPRININENSSKIEFLGEVKITTLEAAAYGVYAQMKALATDNIGTATATGNTSEIIFGSTAEIITSRNNSYGVYADTDAYASSASDQRGSKVADNSTKITFSGSAKIKTSGENSHGAYVNTDVITSAYNNENLTSASNNTAEIIFEKDARIVTLGENSYGAYAHMKIEEGNNTTISGTKANISFGNNASITTSGQNSHGAVYDGGMIYFGDNGNISVSGSGADAFRFEMLESDYSVSYQNMIASSKSANLIGNNSDMKIDMTFIGESELFGDLKGFSTDSDITLILKDKTIWEGGIAADNLGGINIEMSQDNTWFVNKNSTFNSLIINGGHISFRNDQGGDGYHEVSVQSLTGSGTIEMNVNLSFNNPQTDFLEVDQGSGTYTLEIKHNNIGGTEGVRLVGVNCSGLSFELSGPTKMQVGAYLYEFEQKNNSDYMNEWWLTSLGIDPKIKRETQGSVIGFGEFVKSIDSILATELVKYQNEMWFSSFYKLQKYDKNEIDISLKQQLGGGIIGLNTVLSEHFNLGQFISVGIGYQDIEEDSVGYLSSLTVGLYANYLNKGFLASSYFRAASYTHDLKLPGTFEGIVDGMMRTYGLSASIQLSQKISLPNTALYVTPKANLSYTYVKEFSYNVGGFEAKSSDVTGLVAWVGARIGMDRIDSSQNSYGYYLEAGWIHDTNPSATLVMPSEKDIQEIAIGNNKFEVGIGFYTSPLGISAFNMDFKYTKGQGIVEPIKINFGGSIQF